MQSLVKPTHYLALALDNITTKELLTHYFWSQSHLRSIHCGISEFIFNFQQAIVLSNALTAAQGTGFDLPRIRSHRPVSNGSVLGFAGSMANNGLVSPPLG